MPNYMRSDLASRIICSVEDLDRAASARDLSATQAALRTLGLPDNEKTAQLAIDRGGDASGLRPMITSVQPAMTSTKLTVSVPGATASVAADDGFIRYLWLRNSATGSLVTVRELKPPKPGAAAELPTLLASIPKGLGVKRVIPCAYSLQYGIWAGDEVVLQD